MKSSSNLKHLLPAIMVVVICFLVSFDLFPQQQKADSIRKLLIKKPNDFRLNAKLFESLKRTNTDSVSRFVTQLLIRGEAEKDSLVIGLAYNFKATLTYEAKNSAGTIPYYKKSILYTKTLTDTAGKNLYYLVCKNYAFSLMGIGRYNEAEPLFHIAINGYTINHDSLSLASTYINLGQLEKERGNYEKALAYLFEGLKIAEKKRNNVIIGRTLNNIANVYNGQKKYNDAINYYLQAIEFKKKAGLTNEIGSTYGNIGVAYYSLANYSKALEYYRIALPMKIANGDKKGTASTLMNIGLIFIEQTLFDSAEFYVKQSLEMRIALGDEGGIASSQNSLAGIYFKNKQCAKAIPLLQSSIILCKKNGAREDLRISYSYAREVYACLGDYKSSYEYGILYMELNDSLTNELMLQQTEEMKAKYESVKQENKIKDLQNQKIQDDLKKKADEAEQKQNNYILIGVGLIAMIIGFNAYLRQRENKKSRLILQNAYNEIETKNKNITDSIRYAQRIQRSILPDSSEFNRLFKNSFVLYKPKDIVSGDFWWLHETSDNKIVLAVADCTGHGVPGAFMSVMGTDLLSQATKNHTATTSDSFLTFLDEGVRHQLRQTGGDDESRDGMDIALAMFDFKNKKVQFSGALRPILLVRNGKLIEFPAARFSIGGAFNGEKKFINHDIDVKEGDMIYLFTDGFSDQFGGPKGKKFKSAKLKELFISIAHLSAIEQSATLEEAFDQWKGELEQVDDICVAGIRI